MFEGNIFLRKSNKQTNKGFFFLLLPMSGFAGTILLLSLPEHTNVYMLCCELILMHEAVKDMKPERHKIQNFIQLFCQSSQCSDQQKRFMLTQMAKFSTFMNSISFHIQYRRECIRTYSCLTPCFLFVFFYVKRCNNPQTVTSAFSH